MNERMVNVKIYLKGTIVASIPWSVAEKAYEGYVHQYGRCQTLERIYERGGFYPDELDQLYPEWRSHPGVILLNSFDKGI